MQQRETKWMFKVQYRAYLYKCTITWEIPISYEKFADRLRHKIKRDQKKMQTKIIEVVPPIKPTSISEFYVSLAFLFLWFLLWLLLSFKTTYYNSSPNTQNYMESYYNTWSIKQEYLKTGSECEWKPSLSTDWEVICKE